MSYSRVLNMPAYACKITCLYKPEFQITWICLNQVQNMHKLLLSNTWIKRLKLTKYISGCKYAWVSQVFWICLNIHEYVQLCLNIVCSVYSMPEYVWSIISLNMTRLLICLNKTIYDWISLEYISICLKYYLIDTVKLLLKLDNIYKRQAHLELYQTCTFEVFWKCLIW